MENNDSKSLKIEGLLPVIQQRWSPRAFSDKTIEPEKIKLLLEAGRWAPSCSNMQPWRFIVGEKNGIGNWEGILGGLVDFNQKWAKSAPLFIVISGTTTSTKEGNISPNPWNGYDSGQAGAFIILQAQYLGLYTHQMAGFVPDTLKKTFDIPSDIQIYSVMAIGYEGSVDSLSEPFKSMEKSERLRKPLSEVAFTGKWNESIFK